MLQQVMTEPGNIEFREIPVPEINDDQVLVKIMKIGICGSDIHVYEGEHPYTSYPVVQGHEVAGKIEKKGADVLGFEIGDKVTIQPQVVCGECYPCKQGRYNICNDLKVMGFQTTGMASEYFAVDAEKVIKIPEGISFDEGALIEPLAVAVHALQKGTKIKNKNILVIGGGPIGNLVAQAASGMGAKSVMLTEISEYRLDVARKCGIDFCLNPRNKNLEEEIKNNFGEIKADKILECVGREETISQAIDNARKGTDIIVVGVFGKKPKVDLGLVQDQELRLIGSLMYKKEDYRKAIDLIKKEKINLSPLISTHFDFNEYQEAYQYIEEKKDEVIKVIIEL
ncbi:MAG: zinc-dependent alcohol dehydrogenase [Bacillota bacterium]